MTIGALAGALWAWPLDPAWVEAVYAERWYPWWQSRVTAASNHLPVAGADVLLVALAVVSARLCWRVLTPTARGHRLRAAAQGAAVLALVAALATLMFQLSWGLNYRRLPLVARLDHEPARVDLARVRWLADTAVQEVNRLHAPAHARPWAAAVDLGQQIEAPLRTALGILGLRDDFRGGRPKPSLAGRWLMASAVAGFTNPWTLDVVIVPDALPVERPALLLHEWAHLAGLAHEAEAGFVAWLAGMHGDEQLRYSAWLDVLPRLAAALPDADRRAVMTALGSGPLGDLEAIRQRLARVRPAVREWTWRGYDRFLRANRVASGLRSYDEVVGLLAGTTFEGTWRPRLTTRRRERDDLHHDEAPGR